MNHLVLLCIAVLLSVHSSGQNRSYDKTKISPGTGIVVKKIELVNQVMSRSVYESGTRPQQFDNFVELQKKATKDELIELTTHPNGVVRCYALWALSYDTTASLFRMVVNHISDTESVDTQFGCIGAKEKVGDFFIYVVTPNLIDFDSKKLTPEERKYLDSILVNIPNALNSKENAILTAASSEAFYKRARELVLSENNQSALIRLAGFRRTQDIPLILKNREKGERYEQFFYTYRAISKFPHAAFLPFLKKSLQKTFKEDHYSNEWRELYKAIASFRNDTALQLLRIPFSGKLKYQSMKEYHVNFIFRAVLEFYTPTYDDLLWRMWENERKVNTQVFNLLYAKNTEKAYQLTEKTILNASEFYYANMDVLNESQDSPVELVKMMLDTVLAKDRSFAVDVINKNIMEVDVFQFPVFAEKVLKLRDTSLINSLLARLEKETHPHVYLKAAEVLMALNERDINKRIIDVFDRNPSLKEGWGGDEFSKLLKEHDLK